MSLSVRNALRCPGHARWPTRLAIAPSADPRQSHRGAAGARARGLRSDHLSRRGCSEPGGRPDLRGAWSVRRHPARGRVSDAAHRPDDAGSGGTLPVRPSGPAAALGLGTVVTAARLKVLAALPPELRATCSRISQRFHLDAPGWFQTAEQLVHLERLATAVWDNERLEIDYPHPGAPVTRLIDPLGLVLKGGVWYLVARIGGGLRTYRVSRVIDVRSAGERFERPEDFDLAAYWAESIVAYEREREAYVAVFRCRPADLEAVRGVIGMRLMGRSTREPDPADPPIRPPLRSVRLGGPGRDGRFRPRPVRRRRRPGGSPRACPRCGACGVARYAGVSDEDRAAEPRSPRCWGRAPPAERRGRGTWRGRLTGLRSTSRRSSLHGCERDQVGDCRHAGQHWVRVRGWTGGAVVV